MTTMIRKALTQLRMAAQNPAQVRRVVASELKMRAGHPGAAQRRVRGHLDLQPALRVLLRRRPDVRAEAAARHDGRHGARLMRQAQKLGMIHVNVTGGEPMIRKDICELIDVIPKDVVVSIVTNSTLLTEEKIRASRRSASRPSR